MGVCVEEMNLLMVEWNNKHIIMDTVRNLVKDYQKNPKAKQSEGNTTIEVPVNNSSRIIVVVH